MSCFMSPGKSSNVVDKQKKQVKTSESHSEIGMCDSPSIVQLVRKANVVISYNNHVSGSTLLEARDKCQRKSAHVEE